VTTPSTTPSQTVGPFFAAGMPPVPGPDGPDTVLLSGRVLDGDGAGVPDAVVEAWHPDPPSFARAQTSPDGSWELRACRAPYVNLSVFARGLLNRVVTRLYAPGTTGVDPSLVSRATPDGYALDIHLQGPDETVFFAL
jgi:protocatechuate 3,4-dioxygenase, alpha subunit